MCGCVFPGQVVAGIPRLGGCVGVLVGCGWVRVGRSLAFGRGYTNRLRFVGTSDNRTGDRPPAARRAFWSSSPGGLAHLAEAGNDPASGK